MRGMTNPNAPLSLGAAIVRAEVSQITEALRVADGNRTRAADLLGISRKSLWEKMRRYALVVVEAH